MINAGMGHFWDAIGYRFAGVHSHSRKFRCSCLLMAVTSMDSILNDNKDDSFQLRIEPEH